MAEKQVGLIVDLKSEFNEIVLKRTSLIDAVVGPLLFLIGNFVFGLSTAMIVALSMGFLVLLFRIWRRQPWMYALLGLAGTGLTVGLSLLQQNERLYFLPGLAQGGLIVIGLFLSLVLKRPAVAYTSYMARRWPLKWYWHDRVRPAYGEVTFLWLVLFWLRWWIEWQAYTTADVDRLVLIRFITGWPAIVVLLIVTYVYGSWRLKQLQGPSVEEFENDQPPPWKSQQKGF